MHGYLVVLPALLPLMKEDFNNYFLLGIMVSVVFSIYGWGSIPAGIAADHISRKKAIVLSMFLCGVASLFVGWTHNFFFMIVSLAILGIGTALYHPVGFSYIAFFTDKTRGRWIGIHGFAGNMGIAMGFATCATIGYLLGWRATFFIWAEIGFAIAMVDWVVLQEQKTGEIGSQKQSFNALGEYFSTLKEIFSARIGMLTLITILILIVCSGALWNGVSAFLMTYINDAKGVALPFAGLLAAVSYIIGSVAQVAGGELSDRLGRTMVMLIGFGLFAVFLFLFPLPFVVGAFLMVLFISTLGFSFFLTQPPLTAFIADIFPSDTVGFMYGVNFAVKYGIGGLSPLLVGFLADISLHWAFYFFSLIAAVALLFCFLLRIREL